MPDSEVGAFPDPEWLIEGILPMDSNAQLFGHPGCGKTFVALDMAFHIAAGSPWLGIHEVRAGPVAYVFGEGRGGIKRRVLAWKARHGLAPDEMVGDGVYLLPVPVQLLQPEQVDAFIEAVSEQLPDGVPFAVEGGGSGALVD